MRKTVTPRILSIGLLAALVLVVSPFSAHADHSWSNYHWARQSNPFTVQVIDSMTLDWDDNLIAAMNNGPMTVQDIGSVEGWSTSTVLDAVDANQDDESTKTRKRCPAVSGKVRSCNAEYGRTGWLGVAQIWISGGHIVQGTAKMNDSYLQSGYTETQRQHVICQEIGHDWGLGHTSEDGSDQETCMDYSRDLGNPSPYPHDYEQLDTIYAHTDSTSTVAALPANVANAELNTPADWGKLVKGTHGQGVSIYERDFGGGYRVFTFVTWAESGHAEGRETAH